jgi:hypothetical protein
MVFDPFSIVLQVKIEKQFAQENPRTQFRRDEV